MLTFLDAVDARTIVVIGLILPILVTLLLFFFARGFFRRFWILILLLAGALFCQSYFDGATAVEDSIRTVAEELYRAADWQWASVRPPLIGHGWSPEHGHMP